MCDAWSQAAIKRPVSGACQNAGSECQCGRASAHNVAESQFLPICTSNPFYTSRGGGVHLLLGRRYGALATGLARLEPPNNVFFQTQIKNCHEKYPRIPCTPSESGKINAAAVKKKKNMEYPFVSVLDFRIDLVCLRPNPFYISPIPAHFKCPLVRESKSF